LTSTNDMWELLLDQTIKQLNQLFPQLIWRLLVMVWLDLAAGASAHDTGRESPSLLLPPPFINGGRLEA
jgi:hypothetical protein